MAISAGPALLPILGVITFWIVRRWSHFPALRPTQSPVVLLLENLSGDASRKDLADGKTEHYQTRNLEPGIFVFSKSLTNLR